MSLFESIFRLSKISSSSWRYVRVFVYVYDYHIIMYSFFGHWTVCVLCVFVYILINRFAYLCGRACACMFMCHVVHE